MNLSKNIELLSIKYDISNESINRLEQMLRASEIGKKDILNSPNERTTASNAHAAKLQSIPVHADLFIEMKNDPIGFAKKVKKGENPIAPTNWNNFISGLEESKRSITEIEDGQHEENAGLFYETFANHLEFLDQMYAEKSANGENNVLVNHDTNVRMAIEEFLKLASARQTLLKSQYE